MEELALLTREREDGDEREDDDGHREEDRPPDQAGGLEHGGGHRRAVARIHSPLLDEAEGVLGHHDGRVHQDADGDGDARQRHDVRGDPEIAHEEEGGQHGEGDRDGHDEDRAEMQQEEDIHERDDGGFLEERAPEGVRRALDQARAVVEGHDPHARRQPRLEGDDLVLDARDDLRGADAVAGDHHPAHGFLRALHERGHAEGVADLDRRHLAQEDRHAVLGADHDLLEVARVGDQPEPAHHRPGTPSFHDVAAHVPVAPHDGVHHRRERDPEPPQPVRVHVDLVLADHAPDARHLRHAGDGVELVADEPVLERAELAQGVALALDRVPEDMAHAGGVRAEGRHHAGRQALAEEIQALQHARAGEVEVHRVLEDDVDHREAERGGGPHHPDAGKPLEAHRERIGDLVLDLLRRAAGPVGEDDHLVVREVGNRVDGRREQGPVPPPSNQEEEGDHEDAVPERDGDQPVDHWLPWGSPRPRHGPPSA